MNMDENRWTLQNFLLSKIHDVTLAFLDCRLEAYLLRQWPTYVRTWPSTNRRVLQISDARLKMVNPDAGVSAWRVSARLTSWFGWRMTPIWMENGEMAEIWGREVEWDEWITMDRGESRDRLKTLSPCHRGQCGKQMRKELMVDLSYRHANVYALWHQWPFGHIWTSYVTLLHDILICFVNVLFCHLPIIPITRPCENGWNLGADLWSRFVIAVDTGAFLRFLAKGEVLKEGWGSGSTVRSSVFLLLKDFGDAFCVGSLREISTDFLLSAFKEKCSLWRGATPRHVQTFVVTSPNVNVRCSERI